MQFDIAQTDKDWRFYWESYIMNWVEVWDCLVNNAGITQDNLAIRMSLDEWQKVIDINLTSTFLLSKFAVKKMLKS